MIGSSAAAKFRAVYFKIYNEVNGTRFGQSPMPRFDGGTGVDGRKYKPVWPKVAQKLLDAGVDIEDYLVDILSRERVASPQDAVKDRFIERYKAEMESDASVLEAWTLEESTLKQNIELRTVLGEEVLMALTNAVCDPGLGVSPLVRYAFAVLNGRRDLAASFEEAAFTQYRLKRGAYNRWCSDRIPIEWKGTNADTGHNVGTAASGTDTAYVQHVQGCSGGYVL